ncbi:MAG: c-type cytochrome [Woeseiaceae bacterium]
MKRTLIFGLALAFICACVFFVLSMPDPLQADDLPARDADLENGELIFWAGGCASCHAAPGATDDDLLRLSGGVELATPFGVFKSPNISPDPDSGIGNWSTLDFVNAMVRGLSPDLEHYYPAFPYPHYQNITFVDLIDLKAYLDTLPPSPNQVAEHDLSFPYSVRRGVGLWKWRYLARNQSQPDGAATAQLERGRYLVTGPAHCGACHTPRDGYGGELIERFLAGAESFEVAPESAAESAERIPNITPHADGIGGWSESDIAYSLESGFDPDFDSFGGSMVEVQENMARLPADDRAAIAAYLKSIPPQPSD